MTVRVWDLKTGICIQKLKHESNLTSAKFNIHQVFKKKIWKNKLEKANFIKNQGNLFYGVKNYRDAISKYKESLSQFKEENSNESNYIRSKLLNNISLCY
mmetsp:Transcript_30403/g.25658  ORF Transcript_30403/g.25658 Transcript_30403/m.25658 type:complete len:100 (+) Transcript_30403:931-1230(+)